MNLNILNKSKFAKNILLMASGAAFAQLLNIAVSPIITRIYTPEQFGVLTLFTAFLGSVSALTVLSYDLAIPIVENEEEAINIMILCLIILLIGTFLFVSMLFFWGDNFLKLIGAEKLVKFKYFIPIGYFVLGLYTTLTKWAFRTKNFKTITYTKYIQSIFGNAIKIGFGLLIANPIGLISGLIIGQSVGITTLLRPLLTRIKNLKPKIDLTQILHDAKRYIKFPLYTTPTMVFLSVSGQLPVIFLTMDYGNEIVGFYGMALSVTFLPMTLVGKSIEEVFYAEAASFGKNRPLEIKALTTKVIKKLTILGFFPMIIIALFGPNIFSIVFGGEWIVSGIYARILALYVFFHFVFNPVSSVCLIFEKQYIHLALNIINITIVITVFIIAKVFSLNDYITLIMFSVAKSIIEILKAFSVRYILNSSIN